MNEQLLESIEEHRNAVEELASHASRRILIFSNKLEPEIYDQPVFIEACKNLAIRHPQCSIKILVQNNEELRNQEHRLLTLIQRLPSRFEIRLCHEEDKNNPETFMLSDFNGVYLKRTPGRGKAEAHFNAPRLNEEYSRVFQAAWDKGEADSSLRRLSL